ncbi:hypothetical protein M2116_000584 [Aurantimicrobium minutum]|uniref:DNA-directed RNA polymerase subunit beta n=1 Tax=Aurantimicrobium minutum TaxID=708131 RepID=UPI002406EFA1|nr:DNA-directed RNA polymerase subunit beta [Aurantimicrobium minutum]MDF9809640.1 hypothetical protein [Aurantimicrobium minutum]
MTAPYRKPALFAGHEFSAFQGGDDPAEVSAIAHDTARALLSRVRDEAHPDIVEKVVSFADDNGIDTLAELWSRSSAHSLPGALWRMYLIRDLIRAQATQMSVLFGQGLSVLSTADVVVAGAPTPAGPDEMVNLADTILHGAFTGDFSGALDRSAAFCRIISAGCTAVANESDAAHPERATTLTLQASRLTQTAHELAVCARLWRDGALD